MKNQELTNRIADAINCESRENASNTPDFILASYLVQCLENYEAAVNAREKWYGREINKPAAVGIHDLMPRQPAPIPLGGQHFIKPKS